MIFNCFCYFILSIVIVLEESDVESTCSSDYSSNQTSLDALSNPRSINFCRSSQRPGLRRQTSYINSNLNDTDALYEDELNDLINNHSLDFNQRSNLKAQLLKRCGQTEPLIFDEIYSER